MVGPATVSIAVPASTPDRFDLKRISPTAFGVVGAYLPGGGDWDYAQQYFSIPSIPVATVSANQYATSHQVTSPEPGLVDKLDRSRSRALVWQAKLQSASSTSVMVSAEIKSIKDNKPVNYCTTVAGASHASGPAESKTVAKGPVPVSLTTGENVLSVVVSCTDGRLKSGQGYLEVTILDEAGNPITSPAGDVAAPRQVATPPGFATVIGSRGAMGMAAAGGITLGGAPLVIDYDNFWSRLPTTPAEVDLSGLELINQQSQKTMPNKLFAQSAYAQFLFRPKQPGPVDIGIQVVSTTGSSPCVDLYAGDEPVPFVAASYGGISSWDDKGGSYHPAPGQEFHEIFLGRLDASEADVAVGVPLRLVAAGIGDSYQPEAKKFPGVLASERVRLIVRYPGEMFRPIAAADVQTINAY
jgi:hypothetical protein